MADAPSTPITGGPPVAAPPLAGVAQNTDQNQASALDAVSKYGQAGLDAFNQAQQNVSGYRQQVLNSIAGTSGLSPDAQGVLQAQVQQSMAPRLADLSAGQANLSDQIARDKSMYSTYAANAQAALPVMQGNLQSQMNIRDQALQLAQQQLDSQKAAQAAQNAHDLQMQALQLQTAQANAAKAASGASAASAKGSALKPPTSANLFGAAKALADQGAVSQDQTAAEVGSQTPLTNEMLMNSQDEAAYAGNGDTRYSTDPAVNLAREFGQAYGLSPDQVNSILTPQAIKSFESAQPKPVTPEDLKAATAALKGDTGGANAVLSGSQWPAVQQAVNAIATAPRDAKGLINDGSGYAGLTPWAAFSKWITSPAANLAPGDTKTPAVATSFYKSLLSSLK